MNLAMALATERNFWKINEDPMKRGQLKSLMRLIEEKRRRRNKQGRDGHWVCCVMHMHGEEE